MKKKFIKFVFLGSITFGINLWLTYFLINKVNLIWYQAYLISLLLVAVVNFLSSLKLIFWVNYYNKTLLNYIIAFVSTLILNFVLTTFLVYLLWENYRYIIIFLLLVSFCFKIFCL